MENRNVTLDIKGAILEGIERRNGTPVLTFRGQNGAAVWVPCEDPRAVRDLAVHYGETVNLEIRAELTGRSGGNR